MSRVDPDGRPNERNYFRVHCSLALRSRLVDPDEVEGLEYEILHRRSQRDLSQLDPDIASWLDRIEQKLDRVLIQLGAEDGDVRPSITERVVLSGGGIRFSSSEPRQVGDILLIEFELPNTAAHLVRCLGSVIAAYEDGDNDREIAITYRAIHAQDREAVIQHTLAVERGEKRSRIDERVAS